MPSSSGIGELIMSAPLLSLLKYFDEVYEIADSLNFFIEFDGDVELVFEFHQKVDGVQGIDAEIMESAVRGDLRWFTFQTICQKFLYCFKYHNDFLHIFATGAGWDFLVAPVLHLIDFSTRLLYSQLVDVSIS